MLVLEIKKKKNYIYITKRRCHAHINIRSAKQYTLEFASTLNLSGLALPTGN